MKKVLILAYDFPPYNSIGGQRPFSWYIHFHKFGIHPVVVTRHWSEDVNDHLDYIRPTDKKVVETEQNDIGTIIRVPFLPNIRDRVLLRFGIEKFKLVRKFLSIYYSLFQYITHSSDNKHEIFRAADQFLMTNKCDLIIATCEPFILFKYSRKLSKIHAIPWVADYRDGWSTNYHLVDDTSVINKWLLRIYRALEKKYMKSVSFITTTAECYVKELKELHNKDIVLILNGYFEEKFEKFPEVEKRNKFRISYAGKIYPYQRLEVFLEGLKLFVENKKDIEIEVVFYGSNFDNDQEHRILNYDASLNKYLSLIPKLPHDEVINQLNNTDLLLLLANEEKQQVYGKVFDYLALDKKIMLVVDDKGDLSTLLHETKSGLTGNNPVEVEAILNTLFNEWQNTGCVSNNTINIEKYSRRNQTTILANYILKSLLSE